jgi:hypothetical protein
MERWRDASGQGTSEYVALVALLAVVLTLAAGITAGGIGGRVLAGLQRGLCHVAGTACTRPQPPRDDLTPCPVERTMSGESLEGAFEVVKLGGGATLTAVRSSDGRVTVTLAGRTTEGIEVGVGSELALGGSRRGEATAGTQASKDTSRSWTLPSPATARAFVERYGSKATVGGKVVDLVRSGCSILCDAVGWRPHAELPPPDEEYLGAGDAVSLIASLGPASLHASSGGSVLGMRVGRDGASTWFVQLDAALGAELALGAGTLGAGSQRRSVVAYTLDARRRPTELAIQTVIEVGGSGAVSDEHDRAKAMLADGGAHVTELDATLDLHDPRNLAAAAAFADALRDPRQIDALQRSVAAVKERILQTGVVDRRTYELSGTAFELGAQLALGTQLGGSFARTREGMRLLSAETRLPGLPFLPRDDCRVA